MNEHHKRNLYPILGPICCWLFLVLGWLLDCAATVWAWVKQDYRHLVKMMNGED